ncbi:MAG: aminotransferase class IV [Planctomycetes bacterium]|nr:aminotransferase class IV [Planctomycetota bacterium]
MTATVHFNKEFVDASDASLSIHDGGWLHGAGLFETMRAENGRVFRLESHIERLRRSAETILVPIERDALPTADDVSGLLTRNGLTKARLRLTVSAGKPSMTTGNATPATGEASLLVVCLTATELTSYPADFYEKGISVVICRHRVSPTDPIAGHKTTAYLPRLLGLRDAQQARCVEAIWFTTENQLAEGCISNVFVVSKGVLKTPPLKLPILPGITRAVVLEIASRIGVEARECPLTVDDLLDADEVLLTNSIMQIMPVARVERHDIGEGRAGPIAKKLLDEYRSLVRRECAHE